VKTYQPKTFVFNHEILKKFVSIRDTLKLIISLTFNYISNIYYY